MIEIKLNYPIEVAASNGSKQKLETIQLGRLKAKHLQYLPKTLTAENTTVSPVEILPLIGAILGITDDEVGELDIVDLTKISERLPELMGESESQETGKT